MVFKDLGFSFSKKGGKAVYFFYFCHLNLMYGALHSYGCTLCGIGWQMHGKYSL